MTDEPIIAIGNELEPIIREHLKSVLGVRELTQDIKNRVAHDGNPKDKTTVIFDEMEIAYITPDGPPENGQQQVYKVVLLNGENG